MTKTASSSLYALLAFDSYYRGENSKLKVLDDIASYIDVALPAGAAEANFQATVYDTGTEIVIAYRGTDEPITNDPGLITPILGGDVWNGWTIGAGSSDAAQATMAIQLYQSVKQLIEEDSDLAGKKIVLTGHSLGGGLAGLVGSIYGETAYCFDNMPFEAAAQNAYEASTSGVGSVNLPNFALREFIYGSNWTPKKPDYQDINCIAVEGEVLEASRLAQTTHVEELKLAGIVDIGAADRHSMSLLVLLNYARESNDVSADYWRTAERYVIESIFDTDVASKAGIAEKDKLEADEHLQTMLAFTTQENSSGPFGGSAAKTWVGDANDLGWAISKTLAPFKADQLDDFYKILAHRHH